MGRHTQSELVNTIKSTMRHIR